MGWDHHGGLPGAIQGQVRDTDQPTWALVQDLEERGLLEDTIVVWGGEFGRTVYSQGSLSVNEYGRDHHPRCFSMFMLGAGIKGGTTYGATDDYGYNITENPVSVHDLNATLLHLLGIGHTKLTYRYQGRDFRLTDVFGDVIKPLLV
jgi:arylsulfatase A-like enzyme